MPPSPECSAAPPVAARLRCRRSRYDSGIGYLPGVESGRKGIRPGFDAGLRACGAIRFAAAWPRCRRSRHDPGVGYLPGVEPGRGGRPDFGAGLRPCGAVGSVAVWFVAWPRCRSRYDPGVGPLSGAELGCGGRLGFETGLRLVSGGRGGGGGRGWPPRDVPGGGGGCQVRVAAVRPELCRGGTGWLRRFGPGDGVRRGGVGPPNGAAGCRCRCTRPSILLCARRFGAESPVRSAGVVHAYGATG